MGREARANAKRGPKVRLTITLEQVSRRVRVQAPDDLDEAMKMLHAAVLLIQKEAKKKADQGNGKVVAPKILKPTDAEARAILRRRTN
jgi:hypothetical protein